MASLTQTKTIFKSLTSLASLVLVRGPYVKPRDVVRFLGIEDRGVITYVGTLINALRKAGLAKRFNNSRPRRYFIEPWVVNRIVAYGFRCFRGLQCPHIIDCPIRGALKGVIKHDNGL